MRQNEATLESYASIPLVNYYTDEQRFGWFLGNFIPNILTQWGAVVFLLVPMAVHRDGFPVALAANTLAAMISLMNAYVVTKMSKVMVRPEVQGIMRVVNRMTRLMGTTSVAVPITALFCAGQIFAIVLYILGFTSMIYGVRGYHHHDDSFTILTILVALINALLLLFGLKNTAVMQAILFVIILGAITTFCTYGLIQEEPYVDHASQNMHNFIQAFALIATPHFGMLTGLNMPLKNPQRAIPIGTYTSIIVYTITSSLIAFASTFYDRRGHHIVFPNDVVKFVYSAGVFCATESSIVGVWLSLGEIIHQFLAPMQVQENIPSSEDRPKFWTKACSHFFILGMIIIVLLFEPTFEIATALSTGFMFSTFVCLYALVFLQERDKFLSALGFS